MTPPSAKEAEAQRASGVAQPTCTVTDGQRQVVRGPLAPRQGPRGPTPHRQPSQDSVRRSACGVGPLLPRDLCRPSFQRDCRTVDPHPQDGGWGWPHNWWGPQPDGNKGLLLQVSRSCKTATAEHGLGPRDRCRRGTPVRQPLAAGDTTSSHLGAQEALARQTLGPRRPRIITAHAWHPQACGRRGGAHAHKVRTGEGAGMTQQWGLQPSRVARPATGGHPDQDPRREASPGQGVPGER